MGQKVTQAGFARMCNVSRKSVTIWKDRGLVVMDGKLVDVDSSYQGERNMRPAEPGESKTPADGRRRPRVDSKDPPPPRTSDNGKHVRGTPSKVRTLRRAEIVARLRTLDWTRTFDWSEEAMRARAVNAATAVDMEAVLSDLRDDGHFGGYQLRSAAILRKGGMCVEAVRAGYGFELDEADVLHEIREHLHHPDDTPEDMNDQVEVRINLLPLLAYPFHDRHRPPAEALATGTSP